MLKLQVPSQGADPLIKRQCGICKGEKNVDIEVCTIFNGRVYHALKPF